MDNNNTSKKRRSFFRLLLIKAFGAGKKKLSVLEEEQMQGPVKTIIKNFLSNRLSMIGLIVFFLIFATVIIGPFFVKLDLAYTETSQQNVAPGFDFMSVPSSLQGKVGEISFQQVSFQYPGASDYVLQDITFTAKQGETVAFIGSTGSGKSTLVNLIPRFYDATEGAIFLDGVDVREYKQEALHNKIGYVPQKAVMFRGTVGSNVGYGDNGMRKPELEDIKTAVRIAQGTDFVEKMDGAYEAEIAQGGTNVSGGQKQRLAIARAVCRKPEIYIFDDSFSALDYKTDRTLRSILKKETAGVTSLIVAQRIGTIMDADQIIVLEEGRMVGKGTHKELLKTCEVYREIAMSQLSEEELIS